MTENPKWTEQDQERLAALIANGVSGVGIAAELGRSLTAVRLQARKVGLKFGRGQLAQKDPPNDSTSGAYSRLFGD